MTVEDSERIFSKRDERLFVWDFCRWICCQEETKTFYWHDILTNASLKAYMATEALVTDSYFNKNNVYRPFLRRILDGLEDRSFLFGEKTGVEDKMEGLEIIEYGTTNRLSQNCPKFRHFHTGDIDKIDEIILPDNSPAHEHSNDCDDILRRNIPG